MTWTYQKAGVDTHKAQAAMQEYVAFLKSRPRNPNILSGVGPFASCYSLKEALAGCEDPVLLSCCDGVGTKVKLALDWGALDGIGQDLVGMNVNDLLCMGATPLLFLDYYASGKLEKDTWLRILKSIHGACEMAQCSLVGGETAEMPGIYQDEDFDLAGFSVGIADRKDILGPERVSVGSTLIGIESSGLHSNGYSLVRKIVEQAALKPDDKAPFADRTWRDILLQPTTLYVTALKGVLKELEALAHMTGGGLFENLVRVLPEGTDAIVNSDQWSIAPLFLWLQQQTGQSTEDLLSTFNCGIGLIAICHPNKADIVIEHVTNQGLGCREIGVIQEQDAKGAPRIVWKND